MNEERNGRSNVEMKGDGSTGRNVGMIWNKGHLGRRKSRKNRGKM